MSPRELEAYLHAHIPLSTAMQVSVVEVSPDRVVLEAPLAPNINHRDRHDLESGALGGVHAHARAQGECGLSVRR